MSGEHWGAVITCAVCGTQARTNVPEYVEGTEAWVCVQCDFDQFEGDDEGTRDAEVNVSAETRAAILAQLRDRYAEVIDEDGQQTRVLLMYVTSVASARYHADGQWYVLLITALGREMRLPLAFGEAEAAAAFAQECADAALQGLGEQPREVMPDLFGGGL